MNFQIASVFLCLYILGSTATQEPKCVNTYAGEPYKIQLNSPNQEGDMLVWKLNDTVIYKRRKGKIDPTAKVDDQGSIELIMNGTMKGTYKAEHHDKNGKSLKTHSERLCVFSKIPDPKLAAECLSSGVVNIYCGLKILPEGITLTWFHNKRDMKIKTNPLTLQKRVVGLKDLYKCKLGNGLDKDKEGKDEAVSCEATGGVSNDKLFGYNKWVMIGIIAGGGFLLLVLIISLIVICCKNHRRRKRRQRDEQELRLANLQYTGTNPRARPKQTARGQPVPPTPDEEGYLQGPIGEHSPSPAAPQAARQPRPRAPAPPMEDDDEAVPPLPQPRKKGPRHPDY